MIVTVTLVAYFVYFRVELVPLVWYLTAKHCPVLTTLLPSQSSDSLACGRYNNGHPRMSMSKPLKFMNTVFIFLDGKGN